ncbi:MAG: D-alanyl-D-alanine carboxypeptidase family protein [Lawsonibacter sp.]|jgi:D-alanyl-D-alanine carboxypeptidase (penicillin-binding protein 5/6)
MKKYRSVSFLLLIVLLFSSCILPAGALEDPNLQCRNAILYDANYGEVLYDMGAHEKAYPASITKVMTALLVLEAVDAGQFSLDTPITAEDSALRGMTADASTANIKVGETLSVEELLYCLLLPSANEAANILAVAVDGTIEDFVAHMNRRAGELGCQGTHFVNPHGLHDDEHYTTAYDIALFMAEALKYDTFRTIIGTASHTVPATNLSGERLFYNTNALISNLYRYGYVYDKCIGGKTGSTGEAGLCLVAAAEDGDTTLISVVLGSDDITVNGEVKKGNLYESGRLLKWGFDNFERVTITRGSEPVDKVSVTLSRQADEVNVRPEGSITRTLPKDIDLDLIETEINLFSPVVEAPVTEGQWLGTMKLYYEDELYGTLDLVAANSVERSELLYKKAQFLAFFQHSGVKLLMVLVLLVAAFILLKLLVFRKRRRYRAGVGGSRRRNYRGTRR